MHLQVLDATFDDIVPLAQTKMPDAVSKFTQGLFLETKPFNCFDKELDTEIKKKMDVHLIELLFRTSERNNTLE